ncbi:tonB-system energizer ExbB, partial [Lichenihabitans sp. Uapishka_5]|uniref:tonB-system energizer ExbB n=1 Tax=Lichenihabitans sp. Uapishka_5 TaxID=3037302 RepID=UPI0029E7E2D3
SAAAPVDAAAPQAAPAAQPSVPLPPVPTLSSDDALPHDMSPWAMVRNADIIVKIVMGILAAASVATWTIFIAKRLQLAGARFRAVRGVREVLRATSLFDLDRARHTGSLKSGPVAALVHAAAHERERSSKLPADGIKERAAIALGRIEARAARSMTRGTGLVASIGSTAPFVGLFGTVWGIMNAFVGISQAHTTNLAVVAPGIAEALLATAVGLVAAIPAVIIYNGLARAIAGYKAILSDASAEVMRHLSRDLDRQSSAAE